MVDHYDSLQKNQAFVKGRGGGTETEMRVVTIQLPAARSIGRRKKKLDHVR